MADKKISELPLLNSVSGSSIIVPIVHDGTTTKVNLSQIAHYSSQWSAKTGSANTFTGNQTINGNLSVSGRLTVHEVVAQYETASILFSTGSTKLGDQLTDVHEFTGSTNITGALYYNNVLVTNIDANTVFKLQQTTASLNTQTGSQDLVNFGISSVTGAINTTTSSFDSVFQRISSTTGSINTTTSSFDSVFLGISSVTGAMNTTTSSFDSVFQRISSTTGSINTTTSSFDSVFLGISSVTGAMNTQSSSQDLVNRQISSTTGSINTTTSSFDLVFRGISSVTGAMNTQSSSQDLVNRQVSLVTGSIHFVTGAFNAFTGSVIGQTNTISTFTSSVNFATQSLNTQTGSQDLVNRGISSVTGSINTTTSSFNSVFSQIGSTTSSLIGITNGLMAFTAALDSTYATDAQLYQLYQATASIHSTTASLNIQTGSQDLVNRGISSVTGSINTTTSSFDGVFLRISSTTGSVNTTTSSFNNVFLGISSVTGAMNTQSSSQDLVNLGISSVTGSLIGITNGLMAFTAALDSTYATDAQLYQLYQSTASIHFATQSLNTQTGSQDLVNLGISTFTGSLRSEVNLIEAYTASLKGAAIVSSSQQITNYYKFAETASANTFYGNQTIRGNAIINGGNSVRLYESTNTNYWDAYTYTDNTLRVNYKGVGNDEIILYNDGNLSLEAAITASNFKIKTAGGGVDFSADTGGTGTTTWEILNDYEEGTWTGTMTGTVSNPTTPVTATGYYTKIGRQVTISIIFSNVDTTGASGGVRITGVPFATAYTGGVGSVILENFDFTGTKTSVASYMNAGTPTTIFIEASGDETTFGGVAHSAGTGRYLYTTLTYFT